MLDLDLLNSNDFYVMKSLWVGDFFTDGLDKYHFVFVTVCTVYAYLLQFATECAVYACYLLLAAF